ncbi:hypothetical protein ILYODFUR_026839 [Ilyodon furcidens]|uniref:Uncharacterized protein n=1 Tax=Ilyodon furcidens TaxID=33524 RepID=A0ABV0TNW8_9TELE
MLDCYCMSEKSYKLIMKRQNLTLPNTEHKEWYSAIKYVILNLLCFKKVVQQNSAFYINSEQWNNINSSTGLCNPKHMCSSCKSGKFTVHAECWCSHQWTNLLYNKFVQSSTSNDN